MNRAGHFIIYVFGPLFKNGKWLIWFLFIIIFMMFSNAINAFLMHIPTEDEVIKIKGSFVDTSSGYSSKSGLYSIKIISSDGFEYSCNCEPLGNSNCLGRRPGDHSGKIHDLDQNILNRSGTHKALLNHISNKYGELWMYHNNSVIGSNFSCYKIFDKDTVYRSYEKSVEEYTNYKNSYTTRIYFLVAALIFILSAILTISLVFIRAINFFKETNNG